MNAAFRFVALALFSLTPVLALEAAETPQGSELLSGALSDRIVSVAMGWGELGYDTSVKPDGRPAMQLRIGEKTYEHGLGHHAPGEIVVELGGEFKTFETEIGIQWQGGGTVASDFLTEPDFSFWGFGKGVSRIEPNPLRLGGFFLLSKHRGGPEDHRTKGQS